MLSHLLVIMLELGIGFSIPVPSLLLYFQDRFNKLYRTFMLISFFFGSSLIIDSLNRLFLHLALPIDDYLFRISDSLLILAGVSLVYHGSVFPRRMHSVKASIQKNTQWTKRNPMSFWNLLWVGFVLIILSFTPLYMHSGAFNPLTGVYVSNFGPVFFAIKLFFITCLVLTIRLQFLFYKLENFDPRKLHSRYYIYASSFLILVFLLVELLKRITWIENELMALWSVSCFAFTLFLYNIFSNIGISYRSGLRRIFMYFCVYILLLAPFVLLTYQLVTLSQKFPIWLIVSLTSLLFLGFQYLGSGIFPLIKNIFFRRDKQYNDAISSYNYKIQELDTIETSAIHFQLKDFMEKNFDSDFLCFYFLKPDEKEIYADPLFLRDVSSSKNAKNKNEAPTKLPSEIFQLLFKMLKDEENGGLIVDLLYKSERLGLSDWARELILLSACGAEVILPLFQLNDLQQNKNQIDQPKKAPLGVLIAGELKSGRSFDKEDLFVLQLLVTPTILAFKNNNLFNSTILLKEKLEDENIKISLQLADDIASSHKANQEFIFDKKGLMHELINNAERFATNDSPLLITGETGTGKSQLAKMIHEKSNRSGKNVTLNCATIPVDLIENELFGHEKGAYTGANEARSGLVEKAQDGTLFFDEIGELSTQSQTKLLRLLQSGQYERIGSNETKTSNARFIFATNQNLEAAIKEGSFRLDLYYRISTFELELPPLRKRKSDMDLLINALLGKSTNKLNKTNIALSQESVHLLKSYNYPGNIRELENIIFRAVVMCDTDLITPEHLPVLFTNRLEFDDKKARVNRLNREMENLEKEILIEALQLKSGNQREAAQMLEISRGALQYKLKQLKIRM